nr:MAG TPA: Protein of unknown function (DUF551) [Caudoviricetes sp.]
MRLIDAEKFEVFNATCPITKGIRSGKTAAYFYGEGCRKVLEAIDAAPTIDPESLRTTAHWISVKDRLPEKDEYVLCFCNIGDGFQAIFHYGKERKFNGTAVTHWMPLPKPPEVTP